MFLTRALTVLIALPLFAAALLLLPQWAWALFLLPGIAIGGWEWAGLGGYSLTGRRLYCGLIGLSALAIYYLLPPSLDIFIFGLSVVFWVAVAPFWLAGKWQVSNVIVLGTVGWIAIVPMWLALVRLQPRPLALLLFLSVIWIADTFAYLAGRKFGRHKLAPKISPGKSWEGVLGAAAALVLYHVALIMMVPPESRILPAAWGLALFAALLALSIEGDLFESWLKRLAKVKDSGSLLPGHGGILDRIDGLTSTMPLAALALALV